MKLFGFNFLSLDYMCAKVRFMGVDVVVDNVV